MRPVARIASSHGGRGLGGDDAQGLDALWPAAGGGGCGRDWMLVAGVHDVADAGAYGLVTLEHREAVASAPRAVADGRLPRWPAGLLAGRVCYEEVLAGRNSAPSAFGSDLVLPRLARRVRQGRRRHRPGRWRWRRQEAAGRTASGSRAGLQEGSHTPSRIAPTFRDRRGQGAEQVAGSSSGRRNGGSGGCRAAPWRGSSSPEQRGHGGFSRRAAAAWGSLRLRTWHATNRPEAAHDSLGLALRR
mmetsp:Transcript_97265/g.274922  ORF Transcript_97265/g.274922 Transcript_97265/m.274922 type:complete len:245 (+) Transcript_97265:770-1504(+)